MESWGGEDIRLLKQSIYRNQTLMCRVNRQQEFYERHSSEDWLHALVAEDYKGALNHVVESHCCLADIQLGQAAIC